MSVTHGRRAPGQGDPHGSESPDRSFSTWVTPGLLFHIPSLTAGDKEPSLGLETQVLCPGPAVVDGREE